MRALRIETLLHEVMPPKDETPEDDDEESS
jgi:hypothetical protein